jgi:hypothetical protein
MALKVIATRVVDVEKGKRAGKSAFVADIGTESGIPGLYKGVGSLWYESTTEPKGLVVGAAVECSIEERDGKRFLSLVQILDKKTETAAVNAMPF